MRTIDRTAFFESVGFVPETDMETIAAQVPRGEAIGAEFSVRHGLCEAEDEFSAAVLPTMQLAIDHYIETLGIAPTNVDSRFVHAEPGRDHKSSNWHLDRQFPGGMLYIASSSQGTEFLRWSVLNRMGRVPFRIAERLMPVIQHLPQANVTKAQPNELIAFNQRQPHRRPHITEEGRVSFELIVYSREFALAGINKSLYWRWANWLEDRRDPVYF